MPGMRRFLAAGMCVSLVVASVAAPLTHFHDDDHDTDHHQARGVHAHFSGHHAPPVSHDPRQRDVEANDSERAVYLQVFVAVGGTSMSVPAAVVASIPVIAPPEAPAHRSVPIAQGHDPPVVRSRPSRAPPAFLS